VKYIPDDKRKGRPGRVPLPPGVGPIKMVNSTREVVSYELTKEIFQVFDIFIRKKITFNW